MDFLMPLDGPVETLHADEEYSMMPLWLEPVTDCGALKSGISPIGESEWVAYMKPVYKQALKNGGEAYALTIEAAKILNRYFREKPFQEKNMEEVLNIMEMEMEMDDFYEEVTDRCNGKTKTVFQKDKFAEWFIKRYGLINLNYIEHRYNNGVYEPTTKSECCDLLHKYLKNTNATVKREVVQTIYSLLGIYASRTTSDAGRYYDLKTRCRPELIAFQNGIYDISTGEWSDFDPDIIITNRIHADYVDYSSQTGNGTKSSAMETVDSWLDSFSSGDKKKRAVLEEVAGLALYCRNVGLRRQHTILVGEKRSGKSTFISMVEDLVGTENCSHVSMEDICNPGDRFCTYPLVGSLLNSYADLSDQPIKHTARLKNICTHDAIKVEQKCQPATTLVWEGKMLFACNKFPCIRDTALIDRFEVIPCNANYDDEEGTPLPNLYTDDLSKPESMQYWCYLAVQGLKRFIANGYRHTCCEEIELYRKRLLHEIDSVASFIGSVPDDEITGCKTSKVFSSYISYCINVLKLPEEDYNTTINKFTTALKKHGFKTERRSVNNEKIQVYTKGSALAI